MAINYSAMADFDPMGAMAEYAMKSDKAARERADWELAHKAKQQAWDDNQSLRALATQLQQGKEVPQEVQTGTMANMGPPVPPQSLRDLSPTIQESFRERRGGPSALRDVANPEYDAAMKAYGEQVKSAPATVPVTETQMKTVPYTTGEKSQKLAEQLLKQGDIKGALEAATTTLKLDEAMPEHLNKMSEAINKKGGVLMAMGLPPADVAKRLSEEYAQAGDTTSAQLAANTNFLPNGVTTVSLPNGGQIVHEYNADGKMEHKYTPPVKPTQGKYPGMPVIETVNGKTMKGQYIFSTPEELAAYEKTGIPKGGNWENNFGSKDTTVVVSGQQQPRESVQGVVTSGKYAGQPVYKNSKGGAPFVYQLDATGKTVQVPIPGVPFDARASAAAYITPETGNGQTPTAATPELTPAQKKANLKSQNDPTSMRIVKRIEGVVPVLEQMRDKFATLPNETGIVPLNDFLRSANVKLGNVKIDSYDTFIKEATREVQSALAGNQSSQGMVMQQIKVLSAAKTNEQRAASINAIIDVLNERKKGELSVPFQAPSAGGTQQIGKYKVTVR
jgi:hypothetical protein